MRSEPRRCNSENTLKSPFFEATCGLPAVARYENIQDGRVYWRCVHHDEEAKKTLDVKLWGRQALT